MAVKRVLIVDDMPNIARCFAMALNGEGYHTSTVTRGDKSFKANVFGQYDLVFMDLHMLVDKNHTKLNSVNLKEPSFLR